MEENPKKYHITDDGDIYRVNEDGSFTSMGNAEDRNSYNKNSKKGGKSSEKPTHKKDEPKSKTSLIFILTIIVVLILFMLLYFISSRQQYQEKEAETGTGEQYKVPGEEGTAWIIEKDKDSNEKTVSAPEDIRAREQYEKEINDYPPFGVGEVHLQGQLGTDNDTEIYLNKDKGLLLKYINYSRELRIDKIGDDGELNIKAYSISDGKYIGIFKGKVQKSGSNFHYLGIFINFKGTSINFDFLVK